MNGNAPPPIMPNMDTSPAQPQTPNAAVPAVQVNEAMVAQQSPTTKPSILTKPHLPPRVPSQTLALDVHAKAEDRALDLSEPSPTKLPIQKIKHHIMTADIGTEYHVRK